MTLTPQRKKQLVLVGGVVVVAVITILSRGSSSAAAPADASTDPSSAYSGGSGADPGPTTFADNGAGFGQLSTAISDGLGSVATTEDQVQTQLGELSDALANLSVPAVQPAPAQLATAGQPAPQVVVNVAAARPAAAAKPAAAKKPALTAKQKSQQKAAAKTITTHQKSVAAAVKRARADAKKKKK